MRIYTLIFLSPGAPGDDVVQVVGSYSCMEAAISAMHKESSAYEESHGPDALRLEAPQGDAVATTDGAHVVWVIRENEYITEL